MAFKMKGMSFGDNNKKPSKRSLQSNLDFAQDQLEKAARLGKDIEEIKRLEQVRNKAKKNFENYYDYDKTTIEVIKR